MPVERREARRVTQYSFTPEVCEDGPFKAYVKLHWIRSAAELNRCMKAFTDWIKEHRNKRRTKTLWLEAAAKLRGHFNYFGVVFNRPKLAQYYYTCVSSLFRWLNRRSQKRSFTWEKFNRKLWFNPLPKPPSGDELIDSTSEHHSERNHQPKSRMREIRTSGSVRGLSRQWRLRPT